MSYPKIAETIKTTILEFIADLKDSVFTRNEDKGDLLLVEFFFQKMSSSTIADYVVTHVLPHKAKIKGKEANFFVEKKNEIFAGLPKDRVIYFSEMVGKPKDEGGLSDEDKATIWVYFDTLITLAEEYKKKK